jgi:hypothetical protein
MIRIAITPTAYVAIAATLTLGTVAVEPERDQDGSVHIWLNLGVVAKLTRQAFNRAVKSALDAKRIFAAECGS